MLATGSSLSTAVFAGASGTSAALTMPSIARRSPPAAAARRRRPCAPRSARSGRTQGWATVSKMLFNPSFMVATYQNRSDRDYTMPSQDCL
jgi:hypothetical protein